MGEKELVSSIIFTQKSWKIWKYPKKYRKWWVFNPKIIKNPPADGRSDRQLHGRVEIDVFPRLRVNCPAGSLQNKRVYLVAELTVPQCWGGCLQSKPPNRCFFEKWWGPIRLTPLGLTSQNVFPYSNPLFVQLPFFKVLFLPKSPRPVTFFKKIWATCRQSARLWRMPVLRAIQKSNTSWRRQWLQRTNVS